MCIVRYEVRRENVPRDVASPNRTYRGDDFVSSTTVLLLLFLTNRCQRTEGNFIYPRGKKVIFYRQFYDQRHDSNNNSAIIETTGGEKKSSSFVIYLSSWNSLKKKVTLCARNNAYTRFDSYSGIDCRKFVPFDASCTKELHLYHVHSLKRNFAHRVERTSHRSFAVQSFKYYSNEKISEKIEYKLH